MIERSFILEKITQVFLIITIISLYILNICLGNDLASFQMVLLILFLLTTPIKNIFRLPKKLMTSLGYYVLLLPITAYVLSKTIAAIWLFFLTNAQTANNMFTGIDLFVVSLLLLMVNISSIFFKKVIIEGNRGRIYIHVSLLSLISLITFLTNTPFNSLMAFSEPVPIVIWGISIFWSVFLLFECRSIYRSSELRIKVGVLALFALYIRNFIVAILCIYILIYADQFLRPD